MSDGNLQLQYGDHLMQYTTQFIASVGQEEVILDCGSMIVPATDGENKQLPIHTRMALPWSAVHRLHQLLGELIDSRADAAFGPAAPRATLPPLVCDPSPNASSP